MYITVVNGWHWKESCCRGSNKGQKLRGPTAGGGVQWADRATHKGGIIGVCDCSQTCDFTDFPH